MAAAASAYRPSSTTGARASTSHSPSDSRSPLLKPGEMEGAIKTFSANLRLIKGPAPQVHTQVTCTSTPHMHPARKQTYKK